MPEQNDRIPVLVNPDKLSVNYTSLNSLDKWVYLPLLTAGILAAFAFGSEMHGFIAVIIAVMLMYRAPYGRVIHLIVLMLFVEPWIRLVQHDVVWKSDERQRWWRRKVPALSLSVDGIGDIGVIHDKDNGTDVIVITGSGSGIAEADLSAMRAKHLQMAEALKRVTALAGLRIGVSFVYRRRPARIMQTMTMYAETLHPWALTGSGDFDPDSPEAQRIRNIHKLTMELAELEAGLPCEVVMACVLTLRRQADVRSLAKGKVPGHLRLSRLEITRAAETMCSNLEHIGVSDVRTLDLAGAVSFLRTSWDVSESLQDWYGQELDGFRTEADIPPPWPHRRIIRRADHCQVDDSFHATLMVTRVPKEVADSFYHQLHALSAPYLSISAPGESMGGNREYGVLFGAIAFEEALVEGTDLRMTPRRARRMAARQDRHHDVEASGVTHAYNLLVGVAANSLEELEEDIARVEQEILVMGLQAQRITGRVWQMPAMWSATTGIPLL